MRVRIDGLTGDSTAKALGIVCEMSEKLLWNGHLPYVIQAWELTADGKLVIEFDGTLKSRRGLQWVLPFARFTRQPMPLKPLLRKLRKLRCEKKSSRCQSHAQRAAAAGQSH